MASVPSPSQSIADAPEPSAASRTISPPPSVPPPSLRRSEKKRHKGTSELDKEHSGGEEKKKKHHKQKHSDNKSVSFPPGDRLRRVKQFKKGSAVPRPSEEEEQRVFEETLQDSNDGAYQQALLDSIKEAQGVTSAAKDTPDASADVSPPPAAAAAQPVVPQPTLPPPAAAPAPAPAAADAAAGPAPVTMPPPVTFEAYMHYYHAMGKNKLDRLHHPYYHVSIEATDIVQFVRIDRLERPLTFVLPLDSPFYRRAVELACHRETQPAEFCEWLLNYYRPQVMGPNQVAFNVHTILIPEEAPGEWARLFTCGS